MTHLLAWLALTAGATGLILALGLGIPPFLWWLGVAAGAAFMLAAVVTWLHSAPWPRRIGFYVFDKGEWK